MLGSGEIGPTDGVTSVAISPDGRLVAVGSLDRIVRLWDMETEAVYSVAFSPDGKSLASASIDKTIGIWDCSDRTKSTTRYKGHTDFVLSVAYTADGAWLLSGSKDRTVRFWDVRTSTNTSFEGHTNSGKFNYYIVLCKKLTFFNSYQCCHKSNGKNVCNWKWRSKSKTLAIHTYSPIMNLIKIYIIKK